MKKGFLEARSRPGGSNLCLKDGEIWWQGKGGMLTNQLRICIRTMLNFEDLPDYLIIHVGANDLGSVSTLDLCNQLKNTKRVMSAYNVLGTKSFGLRCFHALSGGIILI